jgi:hypothetical protein
MRTAIFGVAHMCRKIGSYGPYIAHGLCTAIIAAGLSSPAQAASCYDKGILEGFLRDQGLRLHSWGLSAEDALMDLWLAPNGLFAVVTTTPEKCTTIQIPADMYGRLWTPPSPNKAVPEGLRMNNGEGL